MALERIWVKRGRRGPMDSRESARLVAGRGIEENAEQGGRRQVTILSVERWRETERRLGASVDPVLRRANLLVSGVDLEQSRDRVLRVGGGRIVIRGETRPCRQMEEAHPGLQAALDPAWAGGAYGEVLEGGEIRVGDPVGWEAEAASRGS